MGGIDRVCRENDNIRKEINEVVSNSLSHVSSHDKTIVEIKLTTNSNVVHGFETQIEEYAKAEKTENTIFLLIDNGGPHIRVDTVQEIYNERKQKRQSVSELIIVDALPKASAGHYKPKRS